MSQRRRLLLKNSGANVVRILAASLIALILPPLLVHTLAGEIYGTWVLILQLSAYVTFFDFGVQTAVGRFVARTNELQDVEYRNRIVTTSFAILAGGTLLSLLLINGLAWQLPHLVPDMPEVLLGDARSTLLLVGISAAIGLPASVFSGAFVSIGSHAFYNLPRTKNLNVSVGSLIFEGLLRPLLCAISSVTLLILESVWTVSLFRTFVFLSSAFTATLLIFWYQCLYSSERQEIVGLVKKIAFPKAQNK